MAELHDRTMNNREVPVPLTFKVDPEQNGAYVMTRAAQGTLKMAHKVIIVETRNAQDTRQDNPEWKENTYNFTYKDGGHDVHEDVQADTLRDAVESFLMRKGWTPSTIDINESARSTASNTTIH